MFWHFPRLQKGIHPHEPYLLTPSFTQGHTDLCTSLMHTTFIFRKFCEDSSTKPRNIFSWRALNLVLFFFFKQFIISSTPEFAESTPSSFLQVPRNKIIVQLVMHLTRLEVKDFCFRQVQNVTFCFSIVGKYWPFLPPSSLF